MAENKTGSKKETRSTRLKKLPEFSAKKSKKIAIMNNKGGCGKTTTAISLGLHLARSGYSVLFWDNDPQSNLTQRLGLSDEKFKESRLNFFFRNSDLEDTDNERRKLGVIVKYPYFYRLPDSDVPPGAIGIMPGSHTSEIEAKASMERLKMNRFLEPDRKDVFSFFKSGIQFYSNYFDYIIMDTAPAMEGNILCQLAVRTADEIICPIDGVEAASGIKQLLNWVYNETTYDTSVNSHLPNMLFAMVKYQDDTKNVAEEESDFQMKNAVYTALKGTLGDFVCDNGIKESAALRNKVYGGFGKKTRYDDLCNEIMEKLSVRRPNIFSYWSKEASDRLDKELINISSKTLNKTPEFKVPVYEMG